MEDFKSSLVGKSCNLKDEIEKSPEELRKLWINRKFILFLDNFKDAISNILTDKRRKTTISPIDVQVGIYPVLPFFSELGYSFDNEVHKRIHECYKELLKLCDDPGRQPGELPRMVACLSNKYLVNIRLCPERKIFFTDDFMKQHLKFISGRCRWEEQTLKVEEEFKAHKQRDLSAVRFYGHEYDLQQIALDFLDKSYIYPLNDTTFPELPGVYLIYHVGKTQLYEGSQVSPSIDYPVYVGMSKKNISKRLKAHRYNIKTAIDKQTGQEKQTDEEEEEQTEEEQTEKEQSEEEQTQEEQTQEEQTQEEQTQEEQTQEEQTQEEQTEGKKLSENKQTERRPAAGVKMELSDFVVRFMIVDIEHYACRIESMLIEYFCPVWNSETVKLSFGNAVDSNNDWHKYHIKKDADTITRILDLLKICSQ